MPTEHDLQPGESTGRTMAHILGQVLKGHIEHYLPLVEHVKANNRKDFLEGFEAAHTRMLAPIMEKLAESGAVHDAIRPYLEAMGMPSQEFESIAQTFLIGAVGIGVANTVLEPFMQEVKNVIWSDNTFLPPDPATLADQVVKTIITEEEGWKTAAESGVSKDDFAKLVLGTGEPPALELLYQLLHKGIITEADLITGVHQGRIKNEWVDAVVKGQWDIPDATTYVRALVQAQISEDNARKFAQIAGLAPPADAPDGFDMFELLLNVEGSPPGPGQLGEMWHRGIIPEKGLGMGALSFEQGIAESGIKTKWTAALEQLSEYLPPPRTITALIKEGSLSPSDGLALFTKSGLNPTLAKVYVDAASKQSTTTDKENSKAEIISLYEQGIVSNSDANDYLVKIGYTKEAATYSLQLADDRYEQKATTSAVNRVHTLFTTYKIPDTTAEAALTELKVAKAQITKIMTLWSQERAINVKTLTEAQIAGAHHYGVISQDDAIASMVQLGYTPFDAWVILSVRDQGPLPSPPPKGPTDPNPLAPAPVTAAPVAPSAS